MKSLIRYAPLFNPVTRTLDFNSMGGFNINKLYGVINLTRNSILYAPGATGYGVTQVNRSIITLEVNTSSYASTDVLNVYYEVDAAQDVTQQELMLQVLTELKVMTAILAQGLNIDTRDVDALRTEQVNNK